MIFAIETLTGFTNLVLRELELKGIRVYRVLYRDDTTIIVELSEDVTSKLRKIQLATSLEKILLEVDYTRDIKKLRRELRLKLRDIQELISSNMLVSVKFTEISQRVRKIILREIERVFKCKLTRAIGDVQLSIRFLSKKILIGLNIGTAQPLYRRWYTRFKSRASLNPVIAAALCLAAGRHDVIMDPFAGSLTIPIEYYRMWKPRNIICIDIDYSVLAKSKINLDQIESLHTKLELLCGDYFNVNLRLDVPCIVTDPPRGLRLAVSEVFYRKMVDKFAKDLNKNGVVVLPVFRSAKKVIERIFSEKGFSVEYSASTVQGGLRTYIMKAVKS